MSDFLNDASVWLAVSAGGSIVVGVLFLQLFRSHAGVMTRITIGMQVSSPGLGLCLAPSLCRSRVSNFAKVYRRCLGYRVGELFLQLL